MKSTRVAAVAAASVSVIAAGWMVGELDTDTASATDDVASGDVAASPAADGVFTGAEITNIKGVFQAELTIEAGAIVDVEVLQAGTDDAESVRVNGFAPPKLVERVLEAQTWDVEAVSGASYTSEGLTASIKDALAQAGRA